MLKTKLAKWFQTYLKVYNKTQTCPPVDRPGSAHHTLFMSGQITCG